MDKIKILITVIITVIICISCDRNKIYEDYQKIDNYVWNKENILNFEYEIIDSTCLYNVYINIRHSNNYPFSNLWLFLKQTKSGITLLNDTVEYTLLSEKGKWLGDGLGDIWDYQAAWLKNVRYSQSGKYKIQIEQATRHDNLPGIMDMGIRVEKIKEF